MKAACVRSRSFAGSGASGARRSDREHPDAGGRAYGKLVIEAKDVSFGYGDKLLSVTFPRPSSAGQDRYHRPNGSGKTTLLKLLLGDLKPQHGTIRLGTNIEVVYPGPAPCPARRREDRAGQRGLRQQLCDHQWRESPHHRLSPGFLFAPARARSPVKVLSGGERNRLLLAKLFTKPSNVLVLDEPTNDLDIETLDLLEELLMEYAGTVLLVSHDRAFINNVVTSTLVIEDEGRVNEYVGGYDDWLRQSKKLKEEPPVVPARAEEKKDAPRPASARSRKLSFKEQKELDELPKRLEELEAEQQMLTR